MATISSRGSADGRGEAAGMSTGGDKETGEAIHGLAVLEFINFEMEIVSEVDIRGSLVVSEKSAQAFGVLHGGITACIAETLASIGAGLASDWPRAAAIGMNVVHLKAAPHGAKVMVKAVPLRIGKTIQVWDVTFSTQDSKQILQSTKPGEIVTTSVARVTLAGVTTDPQKGKFLGAPSTVVATEGKQKPLSRL